MPEGEKGKKKEKKKTSLRTWRKKRKKGGGLLTTSAGELRRAALICPLEGGKGGRRERARRHGVFVNSNGEGEKKGAHELG